MTTTPWRTQQTTSTTGTGTLTLIAAAGNVRSFRDTLGSSSIYTPYLISTTTGFELSAGGLFDGGSPGTLTRPSANIIASSNGGSLISLPAGTADVFIPYLSGMRSWKTGTGSDTLGVADIGCVYAWSGSTTQTVTLPAVTGVPPNIGTLIANHGTAILTIDGNGSETINGATTIALYPGQATELFRKNVSAGISTTDWIAPGYTSRPPLNRTGTSSLVSGTKAVTFATAFPNGIVAETINVQINSGSGTATLDPLFIGASSASGFTVYCSASATYGFQYDVGGY